MDAFYVVFSPICFVLLGLWLVVVQLRVPDWQRDPELSRRLYGVALLFALPAVLGMLSLIYSLNSMTWQVLFVIIALVGVGAQLVLRGGLGTRLLMDRLNLVATLLYVLIAVLAIVDTGDTLRLDALLLTILVVLAVNIGWLLFMPLTLPPLPAWPAPAAPQAAGGEQPPTA